MKQLSIGEAGVIHGKTVLCVKTPKQYSLMTDKDEPIFEKCMSCAFQTECDDSSNGVIPCYEDERTDRTDVFYPEITKGL